MNCELRNMEAGEKWDRLAYKNRSTLQCLFEDFIRVLDKESADVHDVYSMSEKDSFFIRCFAILKSKSTFLKSLKGELYDWCLLAFFQSYVDWQVEKFLAVRKISVGKVSKLSKGEGNNIIQ